MKHPSCKADKYVNWTQLHWMDEIVPVSGSVSAGTDFVWVLSSFSIIFLFFGCE